MTHTGSDALLVINAGSATIKFSLYGIGSGAGAPELRYRGLVEQTGAQGRFFLADAGGGSIIDQTITPDDRGGTSPTRLLEVASEAVDLFVHRAQRQIGSLAAALGGLDGVVFTGGIGENAAQIRERICRGLAWLGLRLDAAANQHGRPCISRTDGSVSAWVLPTDEALMIARHTLTLLDGAQA